MKKQKSHNDIQNITKNWHISAVALIGYADFVVTNLRRFLRIIAICRPFFIFLTLFFETIFLLFRSEVFMQNEKK
jgi:hypothetical protein